jgi:hypothetical protein
MARIDVDPLGSEATLLEGGEASGGDARPTTRR